MLIVAPNPCIDRMHRVDHLAPGSVTRARRVEVTAGGTGVNVVRTLRDLGRRSVPVGLRSREGGAQLERLLHADGIDAVLVDVPGAVRSTVVVVELAAAHGHAPGRDTDDGGRVA